MSGWVRYNPIVEYSDANTDMMLSAPRQAVLLAGGAAFRSTDGMSTTTLATPCVVGSGWRTPKGYLIVDRGRLGRIFAHRLAWEEDDGSMSVDPR